MFTEEGYESPIAATPTSRLCDVEPLALDVVVIVTNRKESEL